MTPEITKALLDGTENTFRGVLEAHIRDIARTAEVIATANKSDEQLITVNVALKFDFGGKTPAVAVNLAYGARVKDAQCFRVEDPAQEKLPLGKRGKEEA